MKREEKAKKFVEYLVSLEKNNNTKAMAALKRGFSKEPEEAIDMHPYLQPWLPGAGRREIAAYYIISSLFATFKNQGTKNENFGASMAEFRDKERAKRKQSDTDPVERRFMALLKARADDLPAHLFHVAGMLKETEVDYAQLAIDIMAWGSQAKYIQMRWAKSFWYTTENVPDESLAGDEELASVSDEEGNEDTEQDE